MFPEILNISLTAEIRQFEIIFNNNTKHNVQKFHLRPMLSQRLCAAETGNMPAPARKEKNMCQDNKVSLLTSVKMFFSFQLD